MRIKTLHGEVMDLTHDEIEDLLSEESQYLSKDLSEGFYKLVSATTKVEAMMSVLRWMCLVRLRMDGVITAKEEAYDVVQVIRDHLELTEEKDLDFVFPSEEEGG